MIRRIFGAFLVLCIAFSASFAEAQEADLAALSATARANSRDAGAQSAYGRALLRAGRYRDAQASFRRAAQLSRGSVEALYDVARVAFAQGDYRQAQTACRALSRYRTSALFHVCNARTFLVWNRSSRAFDELTEATNIDNNNFEALLALGDAHRIQSEAPQAEAAYRRASSANPSSAEPDLGLARLYASANRSADATAALRRALSHDATSPDVLFELGRSLGNTPEARELLTRAVAARPTWADAQAALGEVLLANGEAEAAERAFTDAIRLNDRLATAHAGLGRAKAARGDLATAERELRRALELVPNSPTAARALADLFAQSNRPEDAFEQYRVAADLNPSDPRALLSATSLALTLHRDVLAAGFLDRLLEGDAELAPALALYGDIMIARQDRAGARTYYERALRGHGDLPDRARVQTALRDASSGTAPAQRR